MINLATKSWYKVVTVLLTVFPMLHITFLCLIYFIAVSLYLLIALPYFAHLFPRLPATIRLFSVPMSLSVSFLFFGVHK